MNQKSFLEMGRGAILERVNYELPKIFDNIFDANTAATAKRKLTLEITFQPDEERQTIIATTTAKKTLAPTNAITITLYASDEEHIYEMTPQIPGQVDFGGGEQESPAQLRLIKIS